MANLSRLRRCVVGAICAGAVVGVPGLVGGATAETTPAPTGTTGTSPVTLELDPMGGVSYVRLARARAVPVGLKTSGPAAIHIELLVPRSIARALKLRVPKGATRAILATADVTATGPGYVSANATFSKSVAKRLAAKPRDFTILITARSGTSRDSERLNVNKRD